MYKIPITLCLAGAFLMYSLHLYSSLPQPKQNESADRGKLVWQKYNCNACHQVYGLGGFLGPDLTNVYSKREAPYIRAVIKSGTKVMPVFKCSEKELDDLIAYLIQIDSSGKSDPRTFTIQPDGTIQQ